MSSDKKETPDFRQLPTALDVQVMPQAPGVEKSLLSMMVVDPTNIISRCVSEGMNEEFFYVPAHRILWKLFHGHYESNKPIDITTIAQELEDSRQLEAVGGHAGLVDIFSYATSTALYSLHFETLKEKCLRRSMILTANQITELAHTSDAEIGHLVDEAEKKVMAIRTNSASPDEWSLVKDITKVRDNLERLMKTGGTIQGISTGYPVLDRMINGLKGGELFVIAARPSMGKTSFLLNIMEHIVLDAEKPVLIFSCEMPSVQLVERLLYARSGVSKQSLVSKKGKLSREDMMRFTYAIKEYKKSSLVIDDTPAISIAELRAKARRVLKENPQLAAIGIDYLQLMRSHTKQAQNSREREIAEISSGLKGLAKELNLPIIVLAQLNRGPENRTGKNKGVPMMSDLRESGAIEQDADMIGLLYRSAYYAEDDEERESIGSDANLALAKNRNGPTGDVPLSFIAELMRFTPRVVHKDEGE